MLEFPSLSRLIIFLCVDRPPLVYPLTHPWTLGLAVVNNAAVNMGAQESEILLLVLLGVYPEVGLLDQMLVLLPVF